jgi:hypothetical protein
MYRLVASRNLRAEGFPDGVNWFGGDGGFLVRVRGCLRGSRRCVRRVRRDGLRVRALRRESGWLLGVHEEVRLGCRVSPDVGMSGPGEDKEDVGPLRIPALFLWQRQVSDCPERVSGGGVGDGMSRPCILRGVSDPPVGKRSGSMTPAGRERALVGGDLPRRASTA